MNYKLLAKNLSTFYSNYIHNQLGNEDYESLNVDKEELDIILTKKEFKGLNITMPYKSIVCDYLDLASDVVNATKVCNTIINDNGKLIGYNTDYFGFLALLLHYRIKVSYKNILILGNKATATTIKYCLERFRKTKIDLLSHDQINHINDYLNKSYDIIINTTPINSNIVIDKSLLKDNIIAIDVNFNKVKTDIFKNFKNYYNGLYMLVYQAYISEILFGNIKKDKNLLENTYVYTMINFYNISFIGMPYTGKTTLANELAKRYNKKVFDSDELFEEIFEVKIKDFLNKNTLYDFREKEENIIKELFLDNESFILSTGGGVVTNINNLNSLKNNSIVILLTRNLKNINLDSTRPLIKNKKDYKEVYKYRKKQYNTFKYLKVSNNKSINCAIISMLKKMRCL